MIAALVQGWVWPVAGLFALLVLHRVAHRALQRRRRVEFERHVLELLHLVTRRGHSIEPALRRAAAEAPRRERVWLERICDQLAAGGPLRDALATGAKQCFAPHVLAAIAAADGTAQLPLVLGDLAQRHERAAALRYRALLAASYPALLGLVLLGLATFWTLAAWNVPDAPDRLELAPWIFGAAMLAGGIWLLLAFGWSDGPWTRVLGELGRRVPWLGSRLRLLPASRALRTCASLTAGGADLGTALRHAAPTTADWWTAAHFEAAAELADRGAPLDRVWQRTELPPFVVARLLAGRTTREELSNRLAELSEQCQQRCAQAIERTIGGLQPVVLLAFGAIVALQFYDLIRWVESCRILAMEQMPW